MKFYIGIISVLLFFTACKKETTSSVILNENPDTSAIIKFSGNFINGPYGTVSGKAKIVLQNSQYKLQLDSFMTTNGPDLKVYLSQEIQPINFVNLGSLKSTNGVQLYNIPSGVEFTQYKYALIHCQQYNHLFGSAALKP
jgi:hypothetical protein